MCWITQILWIIFEPIRTYFIWLVLTEKNPCVHLSLSTKLLLPPTGLDFLFWLRVWMLIHMWTLWRSFSQWQGFQCWCWIKDLLPLSFCCCPQYIKHCWMHCSPTYLSLYIFLLLLLSHSLFLFRSRHTAVLGLKFLTLEKKFFLTSMAYYRFVCLCFVCFMFVYVCKVSVDNIVINWHLKLNCHICECFCFPQNDLSSHLDSLQSHITLFCFQSWNLGLITLTTLQ